MFAMALVGALAVLTHGRRPVVLVPGDGGSRAMSLDLATEKEHDLWVSLGHLLRPGRLAEEFRLFYDSTTGRTKDAKGYRILFPGWGDTRSIENLNRWGYFKTAYFEVLVGNLLRKKYYIRNKTLRAAPYDFRKAPYENNNFMNNFAQLIQETFENGKNKKVVIIAHSLGCLYVLHFLKNMDELWKKIYIHSFIATAAPMGGSIKALLLEISGSSFGMPINYLSFRELERSFPSTAYLLPRPSRFPVSQIIAETKEKNYTANDYFTLFQDLNFETGYDMYQSSMIYYDVNEALKGIREVHCVYGVNVSTPELLKYPIDFPNVYPEIKYGDGDGTVNINSLRACRSWSNIKYMELPNVNHKDILANPLYIAYIKAILKSPP